MKKILDPAPAEQAESLLAQARDALEDVSDALEPIMEPDSHAQIAPAIAQASVEALQSAANELEAFVRSLIA